MFSLYKYPLTVCGVCIYKQRCTVKKRTIFTLLTPASLDCSTVPKLQMHIDLRGLRKNHKYNVQRRQAVPS